MTFAKAFLRDCVQVVNNLDEFAIESAASVLASVRDSGGRLFIVGSGGGAGHASHAVCDFRKLCNLEAYAPYDNVAELTARVNDEGWESTLVNWLKVSRFNKRDCLLVFSVGGGNESLNISMNLVNAIKHAKHEGARVVGIVGKDGGYVKRAQQAGDVTIVVPNVNQHSTTPLTEGFQALLWHLLVSHPKLQINAAKWESVTSLQSSTV